MREQEQRRSQEQQRINDEKTRQRLSGINAQPIIVAVVIYYDITIIQCKNYTETSTTL